MNDIPNWLLENSVIVAVAAPIVWLVGRCRSTRPAELHLLWLVLLVKLVTPPLAQWPVALADVGAVLQPVDSTPSGVSSDPTLLEEELALTAEELNLVSHGDWELAGIAIDGAEPGPQPSDSMVGFPWIYVVLSLWTLGTIAIVGASLFRVLRLARFLRHAEPASEELQALIARVAEEYRLAPIRAYSARGFASPCIACIGRPVMLWPDSIRLEDDPRGAASIIAHELAHLARRDHWVARFELLALWAGWWNPLFWLVRWQLHESRELACDALSMEFASHDRRAFAELLLEFSHIRRPALSSVSMVGTGMAARLSLRRRLKMLFDHRVSGRLSLAGIALAGAFGVAVLPGFTRGQEASEDLAPVQEEVGDVLKVNVNVEDSDAVESEDAVDQSEDIFISVDAPIPVVADAKVVIEKITDKPEASDDAKPGKRGFRIVADGKTLTAVEDESEEVGELFKLREGAESIRVRILAPNIVEIEEIGPNLKSVRVLKLHSDGSDSKPRKPRAVKVEPKRAKVLTIDDGDEVRHEIVIDDKIAEAAEFDRARLEAVRAQNNAARAQAEMMKAHIADRIEQAQKLAAEKQAQIAEFEITRAQEADRDSLRDDLELAELGVLEKQVELEVAAEQLKKTPDDLAAARSLKLAELGVRRAKLEMGRIKRRLDQIERKDEQTK